MPRSILKQFLIGFSSPVYSARFLLQKKSLFFLGVIPHVLNMILYFWIVSHFIIGKWLNPFLGSLATKQKGSLFSVFLNSSLIDAFIWLFAILLYGALGASLVNAFASPIYDFMCKKCYEACSTKKVPNQTLGDFIDSIISEVTKAVVVFCVFIISFFIPIFAPILFLLSIWYLGWNSIDRTLLLLNLPLKERLRFGFQNGGLCLGLGLWSYIPFLSSLFVFTTACAGSMIVAKTDIPYFSDNSPGADF